MNNTSDYLIKRMKLNGVWSFDIEHKDLIYADFSPSHHGLQCNHTGGTPEYSEIMVLCDQVIELIKKIDVINGERPI